MKVYTKITLMGMHEIDSEVRDRSDEQIDLMKKAIIQFMTYAPQSGRGSFALDDEEDGFFCVGREMVKHIELFFPKDKKIDPGGVIQC